ncbi:hypothetical protein FOA20_23830 [Peribacillus simplex]
MIVFGLVYVFVKVIEDRTQILLQFSLGILILVFSLSVIGGFEGMPYTVLSLGLFTLAILLFLKEIRYRKENTFYRGSTHHRYSYIHCVHQSSGLLGSG